MRIKNWIEWTTKMSKIWEKTRTQTYCKFLLLPFKCESQSGPENQMTREMSSHCDKNSAHNIGGKYRWIPLLIFRKKSHLHVYLVYTFIPYHIVNHSVILRLWNGTKKIANSIAFLQWSKWTCMYSCPSLYIVLSKCWNEELYNLCHVELC